jgi:hypothetical protein
MSRRKKLLLFFYEVLLLVVRPERGEGLRYRLFGLWIGLISLVRGLGRVVREEDRMGRGRGPLVVSSVTRGSRQGGEVSTGRLE